MKIRSFQPGDEFAQCEIYNQAGASLPRFKPATLGEIQRRLKARDFDPSSKFFVEDAGEIVAYANFNPNGRVSYPWCRPGCEAVAEPLFQHLLATLKQRGFRQAFAAYRGDWPTLAEFFHNHGFRHARDLVSYIVEIADLPTPAYCTGPIRPLLPEDVPTVFAFAPNLLRVDSPEQLERELFRNPYFGPEALFTLRSKLDEAPLGVGLFLTESAYADPNLLDANMPCFRLGAFGNEGMQTKRVRGLFSFLARLDRNLPAVGLDLLGQAMMRLTETDDIHHVAAQVPSDVPALDGFYRKYFRRQGSFPVFELDLGS